MLPDGPLTDLNALLQSGQVLLDHPSVAFHFPLFLQPSKKKKNHLIISGQCGCSLKWVTETTLVLYTLLLSKGLLHPRPISPPLTDHLVRRRKVSHSFQWIFVCLLLFRQLSVDSLYGFYLKERKKERQEKQRNVDPNGEMCSKHHMHQRLGAIFWVLKMETKISCFWFSIKKMSH